MSELAALLFDCDGVLVDTERDGHRPAFNEAFRRSGVAAEWSVELYGELLSTAGGKERMRRYFDDVGWPVPDTGRAELIAKLHRLKTDLFMEMIEAGALDLRPGVARLIDEAQAAGVAVAVCSTSNERAVTTIVRVLLGPDRAAGISIFAGDMVAHKKPAPDVYLMAANTLESPSANCVVVEDSHIGLAAARAAGMRCIVTRSAYSGDEDFTGADKVVDNLDEGIDLKFCRALVQG
ncbi:HAD-IA family hydrolase [Pikeienuella piscinae]|uniref:HAD-IA family hydrolase n=1 Tax=Pikeienuella piscinae TaxID=2748098 RepID=A0A7L5BTM7_9RHOB|nr:HAD-IA family hydrolase [Pikeienuella piscinae]QIE54985.1 HAD-IA family hydrolase [Pikeienuella piscinae]